jgi:hypothetical protein
MSRDQKLKSTITIGAALDGSIKSSVSFIKNGLASVGSEIKTVTKRQQELGKQRAVLEKQGQSVAHLDREYEDLARTLVDLERKQERYNRAAAASRRVGSTFKSMATSVRRDARNIAVGATAAAGAIFGIAASTAALGDNVAKTADRLGIGIGALQELRYAAERTGVDVGTFDKAMEGMQKRLGEAAGGTGTAVDALKALGLSASDLIAMEPDAAFYAIADAMANVGTVAERTALSSDVFGRSGVALLNMTREGSAGLEEYGRQAQRTGNILSDEAARDAEVFQDRLLDTQMVVKGLKNTIGAALMPVVSDAMERFSTYVIENREQVELWATTFAERVEAAIPVVLELAGGVGRMMTVTGTAAASVADLVGGWDNFGMVIAGLALGRSIIAVGRFAGAVGQLGWALARLAGGAPIVAGALRMIGTALLSNPIGLAVAAIAGGAYLIYKNWDKVGPWFSSLWDGVQQTFGGVADFVMGLFTGDMKRAVGGVKDAWSGVGGFFQDYLFGIGNAFMWAWDGTIGPYVERLADAAGLTDAWSNVAPRFSAIWSDVKTTFGGVSDFVVGAFMGDMDGAADGLRTAWSGVGSLFRSYLNAVGTAFSFAWGNTIGPVVEKLAATEGVQRAWDTVKTTVGAVLDWLSEKFAAVWERISPVVDGLKWVGEKGAAAASVLRFGSDEGSVMDVPAPVGATQGSTSDAISNLGIPGRNNNKPKGLDITPRANGGGYDPGWLLTGEVGPELKFETRSGFVATNRQLRQMAELSDRAVSLPSVVGRNASQPIDAKLSAPQLARSSSVRPLGATGARPLPQPSRVGFTRPAVALAERKMPALPESPPSSTGTLQSGSSGSDRQVVQHITHQINATGLSVEELIGELKRRERQASSSALFDRVPGTGFAGR